MKISTQPATHNSVAYRSSNIISDAWKKAIGRGVEQAVDAVLRRAGAFDTRWPTTRSSSYIGDMLHKDAAVWEVANLSFHAPHSNRQGSSQRLIPQRGVSGVQAHGE